MRQAPISKRVISLPKRTKTAGSAPGLPSREDVIAFISTASGKVGKREIARAFNIQGGDRIWLKHMLNDLENEGVVNRRQKSMHRAGQLPPVVLADIKSRDRDGELVAEPTEWDTSENGATPKITVTVPRKQRPGTPIAGVGDRALIRVSPVRAGDLTHYTGRVVKILEKQKAQMLGVFRALPNGGGRLIPVEKRGQGKELLVQPGDEGEAKDGDLVAASIGRQDRYGLPNAKVRERLGSLESENAISLIAIHAHRIPNIFPRDVLAEAEAATPVGLDGREDWRRLPLVTIDPPDAKDHDDAVYAVPDEDPDNCGGFVVTVAIADVAAYVRPGSAMDREALERGNSVYFPDRVVPMLPERIRTTSARCAPSRLALRLPCA